MAVLVPGERVKTNIPIAFTPPSNAVARSELARKRAGGSGASKNDILPAVTEEEASSSDPDSRGSPKPFDRG